MDTSNLALKWPRWYRRYVSGKGDEGSVVETPSPITVQQPASTEAGRAVEAPRASLPSTDKIRSRSLLRDWLSLVIAVLALCVSGGTAYFNVVRQRDDLRVVISSYPVVLFVSKQLFLFDLPLKLAFINSGNRTAAIMSINWAFDKQESAGTCVNGRSVDYEVAPFVIKPGEIVLKELKIANSHNWKRAKEGYWSLSESTLTVGTGDLVKECMQFGIATPDSVSWEVQTPLYSGKVLSIPTEMEKDQWLAVFQGHIYKKPVVLLQTSGTIFGN
jgi:hypothetical protein